MGISRQAKPGHVVALSIPLIAIVAVALVLGWGHASSQSAHADGPRMAFNASGTGVSCDDPSEPTECTVPLAGFFTLSVAAVEPPAAGYIGFQTFIDYGRDFYDPDRAEDDFAPPICGDAVDNGNDGFIDINDADCIDQPLTYHAVGATEAIIWPDLGSDKIAIQDNEPVGAAVSHGGLTGLLPPLTASTYDGVLVELVMSCSDDESSTEVRLLPLGDRVAGTFGTGYSEAPDGSTQSAAKTEPLTINCAGEAPADGGDEEPTATPDDDAVALPPTGTSGVFDIESGGGSNAGLWAIIGGLLAAAAAGMVFFGWRHGRQAE